MNKLDRISSTFFISLLLSKDCLAKVKHPVSKKKIQSANRGLIWRLKKWLFLCEARLDSNNHFDASRTLNAIFVNFKVLNEPLGRHETR